MSLGFVLNIDCQVNEINKSYTVKIIKDGICGKIIEEIKSDDSKRIKSLKKINFITGELFCCNCNPDHGGKAYEILKIFLKKWVSFFMCEIVLMLEEESTCLRRAYVICFRKRVVIFKNGVTLFVIC